MAGSDPSAWLSDPILLAHFRIPTKIHENQILDPTLQVTPSPSSTRISQLSRSTSSSKKQPAMSSRLPRVWFLPCASLKIQHEASPYGGFLKLGTPKWMVYTGKSYRNGWFGGTPILGSLNMGKPFAHICTWSTLTLFEILWKNHEQGGQPWKWKSPIFNRNIVQNKLPQLPTIKNSLHKTACTRVCRLNNDGSKKVNPLLNRFLGSVSFYGQGTGFSITTPIISYDISWKSIKLLRFPNF